MSTATTRRWIIASGLWAVGLRRAAEEWSGDISELQSASGTFIIDLVRDAAHTRMVPLVSSYLRERFDFEVKELNELTRFSNLSYETLLKSSSILLRKISDYGIPCALLKGVFLQPLLYPKEVPRMMDDVDVLITPNNLKIVSDICLSSNFLQGNVNIDTGIITEFDKIAAKKLLETHYQIPSYFEVIEVDISNYDKAALTSFWPRGNITFAGRRALIYTFIDVHFNVGPNIAIDDLWTENQKENTQIGHCGLGGLPLEFNIWFLANRLYMETLYFRKPAVRLFIDVIGLIYAHEKKIDWDEVMRIGRKYNSDASLFYVLRFIANIAPTIVPEYLCQTFLSIDNFQNLRNDLGDVLPTIFQRAPLVSGYLT
jgi:hypothetical protein